MRDKDFYKILDVPNDATQDEIKKAYRKLALKYHPDVNANSKAAESWFRQINEAYTTLSDPGRRSAYNQQRWYRESIVSGKTSPPATPGELLERCRAVSKYVAKIDQQRLNHSSLQYYLLHLLSQENMQMLADWNDQSANALIYREVLSAGRHLDYKRLAPVSELLIKVHPADEEELEALLLQKKRLSYWTNYQFVYVFIVAVLICLLVYLLGK